MADAKKPYEPRVLITAGDRRRANLQGPPSHLARQQAWEEQHAALIERLLTDPLPLPEEEAV